MDIIVLHANGLSSTCKVFVPLYVGNSWVAMLYVRHVMRERAEGRGDLLGWLPKRDHGKRPWFTF